MKNDEVSTAVYDYGKNRIIVKATFPEKGPTITDAIKQLVFNELRKDPAQMAG